MDGIFNCKISGRGGPYNFSMPELPEVETVVRTLRPGLLRRRIAAVRKNKKALREKWAADWERRLAGQSVRTVERRGKWIIINLDDGVLLVHLGMTGQLRVVPADHARETHTHLIIDLDDGKHQLRFRDVRRFGCALVLEGAEALEAFFLERKLGPEPFDLLKAAWRDDLLATRRCLKAALLDQQLVAGVGNIYADEALFEARLKPTQAGSETTPEQAERLRRAIVKVLKRAIEQRGSSIRDYLDGNGQAGGYQREFRVYDRTGEPCVRCKAPIERIRLAGRSTHFCPSCQR